MSLPPPAPLPSIPPAAPTRRRPVGWIVATSLLAIALVASLVALVVTRRDLDEERDRADALAAQVDGMEQELQALQDQLAEQEAGGDGLEGLLDELLRGLLGGGEDGQDGSGEQGLGGALQDLLEGLLGGDSPFGGGEGALGDALAGVDPQCLFGDEGPAGIIGGLNPAARIEGTPEEQVAEITRLVEDERELEFDEQPEPQFLPADEFDRRVADTVKDEYPAEVADLDSRLLGLLGAIPQGTDLLALQADLLAGQVAGFYDPETGEVVVRLPEGGSSLDANAQITLAHELGHALTDQALGLPDTTEEGQSDANLARLALVEGDATLLMQRFGLAHVPLTDQIGGALSPEMQASQDDLERQPWFLQQQLLFPYTSGLAYACRLQEDDGWKGIDAAYDELPATTAEVLFERDGDAADALDLREPGGPWEVARRDTLGAAPLLWLLQAPGGDTDKAVAGAEAAARSWAGDELLLATDGDRSAVGVSLVSDDGPALCAAIDEWYAAAFPGDRAEDGGVVTVDGDGQAAALRCDGANVAIGIGPDLDTARSLLPS
jgi:hypothetical protein